MPHMPFLGVFWSWAAMIIRPCWITRVWTGYFLCIKRSQSCASPKKQMVLSGNGGHRSTVGPIKWQCEWRYCEEHEVCMESCTIMDSIYRMGQSRPQTCAWCKLSSCGLQPLAVASLQTSRLVLQHLHQQLPFHSWWYIYIYTYFILYSSSPWSHHVSLGGIPFHLMVSRKMFPSNVAMFGHFWWLMILPLNTNVDTHMYVYIYIYMYIYIYTNVYVYIYIHTHVITCIYIWLYYMYVQPQSHQPSYTGSKAPAGVDAWHATLTMTSASLASQNMAKSNSS